MIFKGKAWLNLAGAWAIEPAWLKVHLPLFASATDNLEQPIEAAKRERFERAGDVAVVDIAGPMMKHLDLWAFFFGGVSTEMVRQAVGDAVQDDSIASIMLRIDSPGGHVSGVQQLADTVFAARNVKPVHAHIEDLGASAAFWVASQAHKITANATAEVGSIGTLAVIHDLSEMASSEGVKVHVITSKGAETHKGTGVPGAEVTDEQLTELQRRVDEINAFFLKSLARGRAMSMSDVRALADGRVHIASTAKGLGLIDGVMSFDEALGRMHRSASVRNRARSLLEGRLSA